MNNKEYYNKFFEEITEQEADQLDERIGAFPWDQHPYFHSAVPFLPETDRI